MGPNNSGGPGIEAFLTVCFFVSQLKVIVEALRVQSLVAVP